MKTFIDANVTYRGLTCTADDNLFAIDCFGKKIDIYSPSGEKISEYQLKFTAYNMKRNNNYLFVTMDKGIAKLEWNGKVLKEVAFSAYTFLIPTGLCIDENEDIYISDSTNQIFKANSQLNISVVYKDVFTYPGGIEYNKEKKALYTVDDPDSGEAIYMFMGNGNSSKFCDVDGVTCLAVDGSNTLFAAIENCIISINSDGKAKVVCQHDDLVWGMTFNSKGDLFFSVGNIFSNDPNDNRNKKIYVIRGVSKIPFDTKRH